MSEAGGLLNQGVLLNRTGRRMEAEAAWRKALAIFLKLAAEQPADQVVRVRAGRCYANLGLVLDQTGRRRDSELAYRQALAIFERLVAESPDDSSHRYELAGALLLLGWTPVDAGRPLEAEAAFRTLGIGSSLLVDFPNTPKFRELIPPHTIA